MSESLAITKILQSCQFILADNHDNRKNPTIVSYIYRMLVYNETFIVDDAIVTEWLEWIKTNHIPSVLATGAFDGYKALTVLDSPNEGITYCIQYHTDSIERYSDFHYKHLENIHQAHNAQFEERFALFHTLMEEIEL